MKKLTTIILAATATLSGCQGPAESIGQDPESELESVQQAHTATEWYDLRLHIIALRDNDAGLNATTTTQAQIADFTNLANTAFAPARVRFTFDPTWDWTVLTDLALNKDLISDNNKNGQWTRANTVAARYPGKVVIFLRRAAGSNFAFPPNTGQVVPQDSPTPPTVPNFIAFNGNTAVAANNRQNFAHELGHFLGLYHTHLGWSNNIGTANRAALTAIEGRGPNAFDGDRIGDTPQDPGPEYWKSEGHTVPCTGPATLISAKPNERSYTPNKNNVMSYFGPCPTGTDVSAGQAAAIRASLGHSSRRLLGHAPCNPDVHALPIGEWQTCFDYWVNRGRWPQTLSVHPDGQKITVSFQTTPFRGEVRTRQSVSSFDSKATSMDANNWVSRNVNSTFALSPQVYSAIYEPSGGSDVVAARDMTESAFNTQWHSLYNQGYVQRDWNIFAVNGALKMHASWVKVSHFPGFGAYYGLSWADFLARDASMTASGYRVDHFVTYTLAGTTRHGAIWTLSKTPKLVSTSTSNSAFQTNYNRLAGTFGYTLHQVHTHGADKYSTVWKAPHDLCTAGGKLAPETEKCVTDICNADSFCCNSAWDGQCVSEVGSICGRSCP